MAPSSGFPFLDFPSEIRQHVYASMLGQVVHCCPDSKQMYHYHSPIDEPRKEHRFHDGAIPGDFYDDFMYCSKNHYQSLTTTVRWTYNTLLGSNLPSPSDVLSLLLSCKTVWNELEPLVWKYTTFCIGFPQFAAFYKKFLAQTRPSHPITTPRAQLLQRVCLSLIQTGVLASNIGLDYRYRHLSSHEMVEYTIGRSIKYLTRQSPNLLHLSVVVDGATLVETGLGGLPLDLCDIYTLLHFRRVKTFDLKTSGYITHQGAVEGWLTYSNAPTTHTTLLKLEAAELALTEILTRSDEPREDVPPDGIAETDPDYIWLRDHYEKYYGKHPRLVELVVRTKLFLKARNVDVPPVSACDLLPKPIDGN